MSSSTAPGCSFYEWVEGVFENSADTLDGQAKHTRVDSGPSAMPAAKDMDGENDTLAFSDVIE